MAAAQLSFWVSDNPCYTFPTLYFDVFVDTFFLVRPQQRPLRNVFCRCTRRTAFPAMKISCVLLILKLVSWRAWKIKHSTQMHSGPTAFVSGIGECICAILSLNVTMEGFNWGFRTAELHLESRNKGTVAAAPQKWLLFSTTLSKEFRTWAASWAWQT